MLSLSAVLEITEIIFGDIGWIAPPPGLIRLLATRGMTGSILETIKGDLPENAVISVITPGGYCRLQSVINVFGGGKFQNYTQEEINQTIIHRFFAGVIEEPKTGEKYILYLTSPTKDENPFPDGLYCEKGAFMGRLIEQNDGSFMRVTPQDEPDFYGTSKVAYSREELLS